MNKVNDVSESVLFIGCGDVCVRVAKLVQSCGCDVTGLVRSDESAERLRAHGIAPVLGNLDDANTLKDLPTDGKLIYYFAPPTGGGPFDSRMRNFCQAVSSGHLPTKVVYISTSGVYGDCGTVWVTEETALNPQTSRAQRRVDAETTLVEWGRKNSVAVVILRVTGIYGPGRLPLARIEQGHPVLNEEESPPTNRIHVDDLALTCVKAAEKASDGDIFNVSDGQPGTMTQYFNTVCDLLDMPRLPQIDMEEAKQVMNPMMLSYLTETRRMNNQKMIEQLGVTLVYPNLDLGLKNVVDQIDLPNMGYLGSVGH